MPAAPPVLSYSQDAGPGVWIRAADDGSAIDVEIKPGSLRRPISVVAIVFGIMGLAAPLSGLIVYWKQTGDLGIVCLGLFAMAAAVVIFVAMMRTLTRGLVRIHANRQYLSVDWSDGFSDAQQRRWERVEIRQITCTRSMFGQDNIASAGNWGVFVQLPLTETLLAGGLAKADAEKITQALKKVIESPATANAETAPAEQTAIPVEPMVFELPYADIPARHGVLVDQTPHRLTIIVPAKSIIGLSLGGPEAVIELDRYGLHVDCIDRSRKQSSLRIRRSWPRARIGSIKGDLYGMGLTIRVVGRDIFEMLHGYPPELRNWIAKTLSDAISKSPSETSA